MKNLIHLIIDIIKSFFHSSPLQELEPNEKISSGPLQELEPNEKISSGPLQEEKENKNEILQSGPLQELEPNEKISSGTLQEDHTREILYVKTIYNWQLNNKKFERIPSSDQCGYTSAAIFLSRWIDNKIDDSYIEYIINKVDHEYIDRKSNTRRGSFQHTYRYFFENELLKFNKKIITRQNGGTREEILKALENDSPVFTSTMLTRSGHFIVITGFNYIKNSYIVQDPYGYFDFTKNKYTNTKEFSGKEVLYDSDKLEIALNQSSLYATGKAGFRIIYAEDFN